MDAVDKIPITSIKVFIKSVYPITSHIKSVRLNKDLTHFYLYFQVGSDKQFVKWVFSEYTKSYEIEDFVSDFCRHVEDISFKRFIGKWI